MTTQTVPVSALVLGDTILTQKPGTKPDRQAHVTRIETLHRSGRIRVYVRSIHHQSSMLSDWPFGTFNPTETVQRVTD